ncbi:phage major tail protein [Staphylococcus aureus]|nr:phage major tail protein [Staphylococcus aureus]
MSRKLKVYRNDQVVASSEGEGRINVSLSGLEPATTYPKGKYKVALKKTVRNQKKLMCQNLLQIQF